MAEQPSTAQREAVQHALTTFAHKPLTQAATDLLAALGYSSQKTADFGHSAEELLGNIEQFNPELGSIDRSKLLAAHWNSCAFLFQLTNDEIPSLAIGQAPLGADSQMAPSQIESFVFLAIELNAQSWSRTQLAAITRGLNKCFPMPAIVLFRYGDSLSLAVIDRRQHLRDASREVLAPRITVIKDVGLTQPHRAHIDILARLALQNLGDKKQRPSNFRQLYDAWIGTLSTQKLNETFYKELAWWYMWAVKEVEFPQGGGEKPDERNAIGVIRLLTRLIFVWFIKERGLVPQALFERDTLKTLLKQAPDAAPEASNYYQAILQNLFFATLNTEMGEQRRWAQTGSGMKNDYLIGLVYRYPEAFVQPDTVLQDCFANIPFLNGGLFECLDEQLTEQDLARRPELKKLAVKEGSQWVLRVDGFSRRPEARAKVPNKLFFEGVPDAELNAEFETKGKRYPVRGLIDLLNSYKFTVDENTPLDEEVALDPELLGKVFENLLASYNPDTRNTARKQSGSFYTPREVVDYMVDEALIAYFARHLPQGEQREPELRQLLSHADIEHSFNPTEADALVAAIEDLKVLDPACGSGAFPMGMLAKLFAALQKLDPDNRRWRAQNLAPLQQRLAAARRTPDPLQRDVEIDDAEAALQKHSQDFADPAYADYTRKLYLIEKCIFGSDIQPIAVQIAKLRFFIALIVSQPIDRSKPNWNITPLPNLETKIVAANTLKAVPRQNTQRSLLADPDIARKEEDLRDANASYFTSRTRATKKRRKENVQNLHEELVNLLKRDGFITAHDADRMSRWNPFDQNRSADFFDVEWMFGLSLDSEGGEGVFDIVIGNPPYIKEFTFRNAFDDLRDSKYYQGKMDLWYFFACRALDQLKKPHGILSFIATNNWTTNAGASIMRRELAQRARMIRLIDFVDFKVFGSADIQTMILVAENNTAAPAYDFDLRRLHKNEASLEDMAALLAGVRGEGLEYLNPKFDRKNFQGSPFVFSDGLIGSILNKISSKRNFLLDGKEDVAQGIVAPQDFVNKPSAIFLAGSADIGDGIFVISEDEKNSLHMNNDELKLVRPYYTTENLFRYFGIKKTKQWVIYTDSSFKNPSAMQNYPNLKRHLDKFSAVITSDNAPYGLHRARNEKFFTGEKIISLRKCARPTFSYVDFDCYVSQTFNIIKTGRINQAYLTGFLNSSVAIFWLRHKGKMQGKLFQVDKEPLLSIPIYLPETDKVFTVALAVNCIVALGTTGMHTVIPQYELLINGLMYELFFPEDLHAANIHLFDACEQAGVTQLAGLQGQALATQAQALAATIFATDHPIYAMLFDLQALDVVRTIEGKA